jgi:magnesium-transporting ATPase (P-type)
MEWYRFTPAEIFKELETGEHGLDSDQVEDRHILYGENALEEPQAKGSFRIFFEQFQSPLIYLLVVAAIIVWVMGERVDAAVIFAVLIINAIIGAFQEGKAQNSLSALKQFVETRATVIRNGKEALSSRS